MEIYAHTHKHLHTQTRTQISTMMFARFRIFFVLIWTCAVYAHTHMYTHTFIHILLFLSISLPPSSHPPPPLSSKFSFHGAHFLDLLPRHSIHFIFVALLSWHLCAGTVPSPLPPLSSPQSIVLFFPALTALHIFSSVVLIFIYLFFRKLFFSPSYQYFFFLLHNSLILIFLWKNNIYFLILPQLFSFYKKILKDLSFPIHSSTVSYTFLS